MLRTAPGLFLAAAILACAGAPDGMPVDDEASIAMADEVAAAAALTAVEEPACWLARGTAEEAAQRPSPRDSASVAFAGGILKVCYGAPSARGRTIIGGQDPFDRPWRMGADEATALHATVPVRIGETRLEPGAYSIYGVPNPEQWTIVINHNAQRWGIPINDAVREHDLGSIQVTPEAIDHVETLRYRFEPAGADRVDLLMEFETTRVRIPIQAAGA